VAQSGGSESEDPTPGNNNATPPSGTAPGSSTSQLPATSGDQPNPQPSPAGDASSPAAHAVAEPGHAAPVAAATDATTSTASPVSPNLSATAGEPAALPQPIVDVVFATAAGVETRSTLVFPAIVEGEYALPPYRSEAREAPATLADLLNPLTDLDGAKPPPEAPALRQGPPANAAPREADLLVDALAVDANTLQAGVQGFFQQLDQLGKALTAAPAGVSLYYWLLAAVAASSACIIVRRQLKRQACGLAGALAAGDPLFPWTPEGHGGPAEGPA
jgi:hypothetical protein